MKKLISLVLVVCMLMALPMAALAEAASAVVFDANGNEVAQAAEAILVDISERATTEDAVAAEYLNSVYLNMAIGGEDSFNTKDQVIVEAFYAALPAETVIPEGGSVEFTVEVEDAAAIAAAAFTKDGLAWESAEMTVNGDGTVTVRVSEAGVIALLVDHEYFESKTETETDSETVETEGTDSDVPSVLPGVHFTPSVQGKPAPEVILDFEGNAGTIKTVETTTSTTTTIPVPNDGRLVITSVADKDDAEDLIVREHLDWAFNTIKATDDLGMLTAADGSELSAAINAVLEAMNAGLTASDLVVRDLFEVSLYGELLNTFYANDSELIVSFDLGLAQGDALVVLTCADGASWKVLPAEKVTVNADGSATVALAELGVVAFLVENAEAAEAAVMSPAT